ncbi:MAG: ATP-binding protein [Verrucomicrobiae bacterium]|nr:ATP-binding protein [Verrucomicrobiae bacterium]
MINLLEAAGLVALGAGGTLLWAYLRWGRPWGRMAESLEEVESGNFRTLLPNFQHREQARCLRALDDLRQQMLLQQQRISSEDFDLKAILGGMVEGVMVLDASGKIRLANKRLTEILHLTSPPVGKTILEATLNKDLREICQQAFAEGEVLNFPLMLEHPRDRFLEINAVRLSEVTGKPAGVVMVCHDVTRIRELEKVRKEFVANVSHELRTPLSVIKGYVETLLDLDLADQAQTRKFLEIIEKHTHRLSSLIGDVLELSQLESNKLKLRPHPVRLPELCEKVLLSLQPLAEKRSIRIELTPVAHPAEVLVDVKLIERVIYNLLDNALKYTPVGGHIRILYRQDPETATLSVSDNGVGIPPADLPRVFERFYRVDKSRSNEVSGTGLGLSIAKHIVQNHGGRIWVESLPGKGSTFSFLIPFSSAAKSSAS